jgi:SPP1 family predicted phage head-tail adaptor
MRAGNLDREITVQRFTSTVDDYGTPVETWIDLVTLRAQIIQASTDEFIRGSGASDETVVVFRTWWQDGITVADRIIHQGVVHNIKETKEIGRRAGLELRTLSYGKAP